MCTGYRSPVPCDEHVLAGRRSFLKGVAAAAAVAATGGLAGQATASERPEPRRVPRDAISYQLYTARTPLGADTAGTLAALGQIGYRRVEHAGYAGKTRDQFRDLLAAAGVRATSGHTNVPFPYDDAKWRQVVADAVALGQRAIVDPLPLFALPGLLFGQAFPGRHSPVPGATWRLYADALNQAGAVAKGQGVSVGYHNHNVEFLPVADSLTAQNGLDILLQNTDPELVHFELDLYWITYAGRDAREYLRAYPGRFRRFHVKDMAQDGSITQPGKGVIDFARIFAAAADAGAPIEEYIVEQDNAGNGALTTAQLGFDLLSRIEF